MGSIKNTEIRRVLQLFFFKIDVRVNYDIHFQLFAVSWVRRSWVFDKEVFGVVGNKVHSFSQ